MKAAAQRMTAEQRQQAHWRASLKLTAGLLAIWFAVTFVVAFFARNLNFQILGWPFSFWVAAQGGLVVYVAISWFHSRRMDRLDAEYGLGEP
jgi:putative solute:sodium symporter small subunit